MTATTDRAPTVERRRPGLDDLGEGVRDGDYHSEASSGRSRFRTDIQGLRAIAVSVVVLYHCGVPFLTGGYVGVDVFFVISGFLISSHLIGEMERTGRVSIRGFYARRIRRLLPAALIVVTTTVAVAALWGPVLEIADTAEDGLFATFYAMNYHLVGQGLDYQQAGADPSPFQHFWSLAVEEQFYVVWPVLLALVASVFRRTPRVVRRLLVGLVGAGVVVLSLRMSMELTADNPPLAYYGLQTRAWELAAGALVAAAAPALARCPRLLAAVLTWAGLVALVAPVVVFDDATAFPGSLAAIPVAGTALVIAGGLARPRRGADAVLRARPLQFVGAVSYGWYLWHWPVLILGPSVYGREFGLAENLMVCLLALWFATLSFLLVEQPSTRLRLRLRGWATVAAGMSLVVVASSVAAIATAPDVQGDGAEVMAAEVSSMTEVTATLDTALRTSAVPSNLEPPIASADADVPQTSLDGCHLPLQETEQPACVYGDAGADRTMLLFGDSHAEQWFGALERIAERDGWRLVSWTKVACPLADVPMTNDQLDRRYLECGTWRDERMAAIAELAPELVVASQSDSLVSHTYSNDDWADGTAKTLRQLAKVAPVVMLGDTPRGQDDVPACLAENLDDALACRVPSDRGLLAEPGDYGHLPGRHEAVRRAIEPVDVTYADTQRWLCRDQWCPAIVGSTLVYRDDSHLSQQYSRVLAPLLAQVLDQALGTTRKSTVTS